MRALAAFVVLLFVAACQAPPPAEMTEAERAQIEAEILEVAETWVDGLRQFDGDLIAAAIHPDLAVFAYQGRILDRAGYRDAIVAWMEGKESYKGGWLDTHVRVISPDLAVFSATAEDTIQYSDGRTVHRPNSTVALFERTTEGWKWSVASHGPGVAQVIEET